MGKKRPAPQTTNIEAGGSSSLSKETIGQPADQALASCSSSTISNTKRFKCAEPDTRIEGNIKLVISDLSQLQHRYEKVTSNHIIANLPWRLSAIIESSERTNNVKSLGVYICCNPESQSTLWSCEAVVQLKLHSQSEDVRDLTHEFSKNFRFNGKIIGCGIPSFIKWDDIINVDKGYIKSDSVIIEAHVTVQKVRGVRLSPTFDFTQPHLRSDGIIVIDGVRLHVSKLYLALYSPVFSTLFFGEFRESDMDEVPLEDVILEEFVELLQVVYPSHKKVTAETVKFLLELGDKYAVKYVLDECERFLITNNEIQIITKLLWADQYELAHLHDACIRMFRTMTEIKNLKSLEKYENLSDATKSALLDKMLKLM